MLLFRSACVNKVPGALEMCPSFELNMENVSFERLLTQE